MASGRMIALLGLLAVAGYQHRDKLGALLERFTGRNARPESGEDSGESPEGGGFLSGLGSLFGGNSRNETTTGLSGILGGRGGLLSSQDGTTISGGLRDLVDRFTGSGHGEEARSWVETGENRGISLDALDEALGDDTLTELSSQTGLGRNELLTRLSEVLPQAVDRLTPDGRIPSEGEASRGEAEMARA